MHALAIGYSPAYLTENADGIRRDWPRIPLPADRKALEASAALGEQIAALLDTEADVPGVTCGKMSPLFKTIGLITKIGGGQLDPDGGDLAVTAGWGHKGKEGVTMPAKGKLAERHYDEAEAKAIDAEAAARGMSAEDVRRLLGERTLRRVPERRGLLAQHSLERVGVLHRRLSGHQEMAELPRRRDPRPGA